MTLEEIYNFIVQLLTNPFIKVLVTTLLFILVWWLVTIILKGIKKRLYKKNAERLITSVVINCILWGIRILLIVVYASIVGIDTAGLAALIASAGVAIGLALQGSLSNLAGGIVLIVTRPFAHGDYIDAAGTSGTVEEIKFFYTVLITPDNKVVMIPNGTLANGVIINYSTLDLRRVDLQFTISYEDDVNKAIELITNICKNHNLVLQDRAIFVKESGHLDSAVSIATRVWVNNDDYWTVHFDILKDVREAFNKNEISIPYPQLDVHQDK